MKKQTGFTLIELMIVIAIIGIMSAVALPAYQGYTAKAKVAAIDKLVAGNKIIIAELYSQEGVMPAPANREVAQLVSVLKLQKNVGGAVYAAGTGADADKALLTITLSNISTKADGEVITYKYDGSSGYFMNDCGTSIDAEYHSMIPVRCRAAKLTL